MPSTVQFRRGTSSQNDSFTGSNAEITVDTTNKTLRVHDGSTAGGSKLAKAEELDLQVVGDDSATFTMTVGTDVLQFSGGNGITTSTSSSKIVNIALDSTIITLDSIASSDSTEVLIDDGFRVTGTAHIPTLETNQLSSNDSTAIQINDSVNISGTLSVNNFDINSITSTDSTGVLINDNLVVAGVVKTLGSSTLQIEEGVNVLGTLQADAVDMEGFSSQSAGENADLDSAVEDVDTFTAATFRSGEYVYSATNTEGGATGDSTSGYEAGKIIIMHDGTTAYISQYGVVNSGTSPLLTFSADIDSGNVRLRAASHAANTSIKFHRTLIKV